MRLELFLSVVSPGAYNIQLLTNFRQTVFNRTRMSIHQDLKVSLEIAQIVGSFEWSCWWRHEVGRLLRGRLSKVQHTDWITNESVQDFEAIFRPSQPQDLWFAFTQLLQAYA